MQTGLHERQPPLQAAEQRVTHAEGQVAAVVVVALLGFAQLVVAAGRGRAEQLPAGFGPALLDGGALRCQFGDGEALGGSRRQAEQQAVQRQGRGLQRAGQAQRHQCER
ncbi:hypothetical protein D9M71_178340 [compost metagenome]